MAVRPRHGDDEIRLAVDLALLGLRIDDQKGNEEQKCDDLKRLKQHHAERIERPFARVVAEAIHPDRAPGWRPRKPRSGRSSARTASPLPRPACSTAPER